MKTKKIEKTINNLKHKIKCKTKTLENSKSFMKSIQKAWENSKPKESTELTETIEKLKVEVYWTSIFYPVWKRVIKQSTQIFKLQQRKKELQKLLKESKDPKIK